LKLIGQDKKLNLTSEVVFDSDEMDWLKSQERKCAAEKITGEQTGLSAAQLINNGSSSTKQVTERIERENIER